MLFDLARLFEPIEPPRQPDTTLPSHAVLKAELERAAFLLKAMAGMTDAAPFADEAFDGLDRSAADALRTAQTALASFRLSRDCSGSG